MIELLKNALENSKSSEDRFVFISDTALPLQSFEETYQTIMGFEDTQLCVCSRQQWAERKKRVIVKSSQWIILTKKDAIKSVQMWPESGTSAEEVTFQQFMNDYKNIIKKDNRRFLWYGHGCLDEYYFSAVLWGNFNGSLERPSIAMPVGMFELN